MQPAEFDHMAAVEGDHWWYRGFRDLIGRLLRDWRRSSTAAPRVLDAGCGTGENLRLLGDALQPAYLGGFDASERAVEYARAKAPQADVYTGDLRRPEIRVPSLDVILCADVIYMTGAEAARPGLRELAGRMNAGGILLLHVPAFNWLYSRHDVSQGTRQRFTRREIGTLLEGLGLQVERLAYRMCLLFPAIVASRLPSLWRRTQHSAGMSGASDVRLPPRWINRGLTNVVRLENRLIARGVPLGWGSSIIAVGRKP
jgi:SAM-dependent methyltransferase